MRRLAALLAFLSVALPSSAHARRAHAARVGPSLLTLALTSAEDRAHALWGAVPCGGRFSLELAPGEPAWAGYASWTSPSGFSWDSPPASWSECAIVLRSEDWSNASIETNWPLLCTVVMHEWGHLTGHSHSDEATPNAPDVAPDTAEQASVMLSGNGDTDVDRARCGWTP